MAKKKTEKKAAETKQVIHPVAAQTMALLRQDRSLAGWKVSQTTQETYQLHVSKKARIEDAIAGMRDTIQATVYVRTKQGLGESSFLLATTKKVDMKKAIREAKLLALHVEQDAFELPKGGKNQLPMVILDDAELLAARRDGRVNALLNATKEEIITEFKRLQDVRLSSMELHASFISHHLWTSTHIDMKSTGTRVYLEMVITAKKGRREQEYTPSLEVRRLADLDIKRNIKEWTAIARDVAKSKRPKPYLGAVVISSDALVAFFAPHLSENPLVTHASAKLAHMGLSRYKQNEDVAKEYIDGDRITIISNPLLNYNIGSTLYDEDGVPARKLALIKDGRFKSFIAPKKYADYLKISPSGPLGAIEVLPGSASEKELLKGMHGAKGVYEIVSFSSFVPNDISGDFAAEIRLGYYHKDGKKIPLKGGMLSGNLFELASHWLLSKETMQKPGYAGPTALYLPEASIF